MVRGVNDDGSCKDINSFLVMMVVLCLDRNNGEFRAGLASWVVRRFVMCGG